MAWGSMHRTLVLTALVVACRGKNCDNSAYLECTDGQTVATGCCGEGFEVRSGLCKRCRAGEFKAWDPGWDSSWDSSYGYNKGHKFQCKSCPFGKYQSNSGCNFCNDCDGQVTDSKHKCCQSNVQFVHNDDCSACSAQPAICLKSATPHELQECVFSSVFSPLDSLIPSVGCLAGISRKACTTSSRVTFSMMPTHWIDHVKNLQGPANQCTNINRPTFNPRGIPSNCDGFSCSAQPSNECFVNKNSIGYIPCDIIDRCMTMKEIVQQWDANFDRTLLNQDWGDNTFQRQDVYNPTSILLRMPPDMEIRFYALSTDPSDLCSESHTLRKWELTGHAPTDFYAREWNSQLDKFIFKKHDTLTQISEKFMHFNNEISISFKIRHRSGFCVCESLHGGENFNEALGLFQSCRRCNAAEFLKVRPSSNPCNSKSKECVMCNANWHGSPDKTACVECIVTDKYKPFRPDTEILCRTCYSHEAWDGVACVVLKNISLVSGNIEWGYDQFKTAVLAEAQTVPRGSYRYFDETTDMYKIQSCFDFAEFEAKCSEQTQYLHACTGDLSQNRGIFYVHTSTGPMLWSSYRSQMREAESVEVVREGVCKDCIMCTNGKYRKGCSYTAPTPPHRIRPDVHYASHEINTGTCEPCEQATKQKDEWYSHPQQTEMGCGGWDTGYVVTMPYDILPCVDVKKTDDGYVLLAGCGRKDFSYWDNTDPNSAIASRTCEYGKDKLCVPHPNGSGDLVQLRWSDYRNSTTEIPYCPPKWHVDEQCVKKDMEKYASDPKAMKWNAECCVLCKDCDFVYTKRSNAWRQCSGATTTDTQSANCVDNCDHGFYEVEQKDENNVIRSVCRPCETCQ
jgi:hypothetical protein